MYYGWISCDRARRVELEAIGITLGKYDSTRFLNCFIPDDAMEGLEELSAGGSILFLVDYCQESGAVC